MTHYTAIKYTKSNPSKIIANRLQVKVFKNSSDLGAFLCKQDNSWREGNGSLPTKRGYYRYAGGAWHNEKSLDASVLAHV